MTEGGIHPQRVLFERSNVYAALVVGACLAMAAMSLPMALFPTFTNKPLIAVPLGWLAFVLFGVSAVFTTFRLIFSPKSIYEVSDRGIKFNLQRGREIGWENVQGVAMKKGGRQDWVVLTLTPEEAAKRSVWLGNKTALLSATLVKASIEQLYHAASDAHSAFHVNEEKHNFDKQGDS